MPGVWILFGTLIFSVSAFLQSEQQVEITLEVVQGHVAVLPCDSDLDNGTRFTWTKDNHTVEPSAHVIMQDQLLWLLNTTCSDTGLYVCQSSNSTFSMESRVFLIVEAGPCPSAYEIDLSMEENNVTLHCDEEHVPVLGPRLQVQWRKDCKSTGIQGSEFSIVNVTMSDMGNYTCLVTFRYKEQNYTASHTFQLKVIKKEPVKKPRVIQPRNNTQHAEPGVDIKLECTVFIGFGEESRHETTVYWLINRSYVKDYPGLQENLTTNYIFNELKSCLVSLLIDLGDCREMRGNSWLYGNLTLFIPKVLPEFFGVPFECIIMNPIGKDIGQVWLRQDDNSCYTLSYTLIGIVLFILVVVVGVLYKVFKTDLILAYYHLGGINQGNDGYTSL